MSDKPILFSGPMIRALIDGRKTQTRRVLKPWPGMQAKWLTMETLHRAPACYLAKVEGNLGVQMQHPLAGTTQTYGDVDEMSPLTWVRLPYAPGDRLYVREACHIDGDQVNYRADTPESCDTTGWGWRPSIHMPRWASRLTLTVTDVRVQRAQEISEADAQAEGVTPIDESNERKWEHYSPYGVAFHTLWDSLNEARGYGWDANPWVAAYTFTVHRQNIDQMGASR